MNKLKYFFFLLLVTVMLVNCKVQYAFNPPTSIDADSFQVTRFENNANLVEPGLERDFKITLEDLIQNQTNLNLTSSNPDLIYEGEITEYRISPTTSTSQNTAAQNRLTISVRISFYNRNKEEDDLENKSFSFFYDYPGSAQLIGAQKTTAHEEILDRLTQDIFNATLARW